MDGVSPVGGVRLGTAVVPAGEVLDLACGGGRHARLFAALGHPVLAMDRDPAALAAWRRAGHRRPAIRPRRRRHALAVRGAFAGIVGHQLLHRPLRRAGGGAGRVLIYETFRPGNEAFGKPSNPDFLLAPGELLALRRARMVCA